MYARGNFETAGLAGSPAVAPRPLGALDRLDPSLSGVFINSDVAQLAVGLHEQDVRAANAITRAAKEIYGLAPALPLPAAPRPLETAQVDPATPGRHPSRIRRFLAQTTAAVTLTVAAGGAVQAVSEQPAHSALAEDCNKAVQDGRVVLKEGARDGQNGVPVGCITSAQETLRALGAPTAGRFVKGWVSKDMKTAIEWFQTECGRFTTIDGEIGPVTARNLNSPTNCKPGTRFNPGSTAPVPTTIAKTEATTPTVTTAAPGRTPVTTAAKTRTGAPATTVAGTATVTTAAPAPPENGRICTTKADKQGEGWLENIRRNCGNSLPGPYSLHAASFLPTLAFGEKYVVVEKKDGTLRANRATGGTGGSRYNPDLGDPGGSTKPAAGLIKENMTIYLDDEGHFQADFNVPDSLMDAVMKTFVVEFNSQNTEEYIPMGLTEGYLLDHFKELFAHYVEELDMDPVTAFNEARKSVLETLVSARLPIGRQEEDDGGQWPDEKNNTTGLSAKEKCELGLSNEALCRDAFGGKRTPDLQPESPGIVCSEGVAGSCGDGAPDVDSDTGREEYPVPPVAGAECLDCTPTPNFPVGGGKAECGTLPMIMGTCAAPKGIGPIIFASAPPASPERDYGAPGGSKTHPRQQRLAPVA